MVSDKFMKDLARGEVIEQAIISSLNKEAGEKGEGIKFIKNPNEKGVDVLRIEGGIEIKADHYTFDRGLDPFSGNAYIEVECYGKLSGIMKEEEIIVSTWIHSYAPGEAFILDCGRFRAYVSETILACEKNSSLTSKGHRLVYGGDGKLSKGLLIPMENMNKLCERILYF